MVVQIWVRHIIRIKCEIIRALNDWIVRSEQVNLAIVQVTAAELAASHVHVAVLAVPHEDRRLDWADEEGAALAPVDLYLPGVIQDLDNAVLEILDHELDAINVSRLLDERLVLLILEHVVLLVQLFLLIYI